MTDLAQARCVSDNDISAGLLNSTQTIEWTGPMLPATMRTQLPALMDKEHFAAVHRSVLGIIRCDVREDRVVCSLFGLVPVLTFGAPVTSVEDTAVRRIWSVTGGLFARRGSVYGNLTFSWFQTEETELLWHHRLTSSVEGYPSRFIGSKNTGVVGAVLHRIAGWYAMYHGTVTCRFLRRLARWINTAAERETI